VADGGQHSRAVAHEPREPVLHVVECRCQRPDLCRSAGAQRFQFLAAAELFGGNGKFLERARDPAHGEADDDHGRQRRQAKLDQQRQEGAAGRAVAGGDVQPAAVGHRDRQGQVFGLVQDLVQVAGPFMLGNRAPAQVVVIPGVPLARAALLVRTDVQMRCLAPV